jgi:CubicO group peptidase (beta-lactamase class C family)
MTTDTVFRIRVSNEGHSPAPAVMSLVEEGKIALGDPVSRYIPGFARTTVAMPADSANGSGGEIKIRSGAAADPGPRSPHP